MRALTIHQPYAFAIVSGLKEYETRPQQTHIRGRIAIHAGLKRVSLDLFREQGITLPEPDTLVYGAVIGTVEITACIPTDNLRERVDVVERTLGDWRPDRFAWVLANPVVFQTPIPAKGKQGWWEWEEPKQDRACKNCKFWRPLDGVCLNENSEQHNYMIERNSSCPAWIRSGDLDRLEKLGGGQEENRRGNQHFGSLPQVSETGGGEDSGGGTGEAGAAAGFSPRRTEVGRRRRKQAEIPQSAGRTNHARRERRQVRQPERGAAV